MYLPSNSIQQEPQQQIERTTVMWCIAGVLPRELWPQPLYKSMPTSYYLSSSKLSPKQNFDTITIMPILSSATAANWANSSHSCDAFLALCRENYEPNPFYVPITASYHLSISILSPKQVRWHYHANPTNSHSSAHILLYLHECECISVVPPHLMSLLS